jgi:DNA repair exonuclease SbcCD ATPase subunit
VRSRSDLPPIPTKGRTDLPPVPEPKPKSSFKKQLPIVKTSSDSYTSANKDVQFMMQIKDNKIKSTAKMDDDASFTTETTETTLVDRKENEMKEEFEMLKRELEVVKARCERAERDKSDILLRRLASMDTTSNKTAAAEALKLQQKVNEMKQQIEDLQDEKKSLGQKVKELTSKSSKSIEETLRTKLEQAERMCEALMDENEEIKREVKNMESEMDELQDNFREEQADEYVSVKKELEQTTKNCRILSFKLKKSDRKIEQLEVEKQSSNSSSEMAAKMKQLEDELKVANEVARRLQSESEQAADSKKKAPTLGKIGKSTSDGGGGKVSRASLTRGGSQEDPVQLLRDLQDSAERETDLREQLKFAEEEVRARAAGHHHVTFSNFERSFFAV